MLQILVLHKEKTHLQMILFISSVSGVGGAKLMQGFFFHFLRLDRELMFMIFQVSFTLNIQT